MNRIYGLVIFVLVIFSAVPHLQAQSDPWDTLYKAARGEGKVIWQLGSPVENYKPMIDAFEKRYPGVKIEPVRSTASSMIARLVTESSVGNVSVDVAFANLHNVRPLLDRDLLVRNDWKGFGNIDRSTFLLDGRYLTLYGFSSCVVYNTNLVPPAKVPRKWEDLLNPEWKGQICVPQTQIALSVVFEIWDESKAVKYLEALAKQNLVVESGSNMTMPRCANGEVALADTIITLFPSFKAQGMPIDVAPISPQWDSPYGVYSVKGAPHPNAAKLLMAWSITPEGQAANRKSGRGLSSPCNASEQAQIYCDKGIKLIGIDSIEKGAKVEKMIERTRTILGLKPPT
jgi:iron(III) transport system substrate-binding protein